MIPSNLTAREVLCWIDMVIGHPRFYTANRLNVGKTTIENARRTLTIKLGIENRIGSERYDVAALVRAAYAMIRDR